MKCHCFVVAIVLPLVLATNPVEKVVQLLSDLEAKVTAEGAQAKKDFIEFTAWCDDRSRELAFQIKTGKGTSADLNAAIEEESANIGALTSKLEELIADLATNDADLTAARHIRADENGAFTKEDADLTEAISTLERAIRILTREAAKGGASMLQVKNAGTIAQALNVLVEAAEISTADSARLSALVQTSQGSEDEDVGAPSAAVYKSHSSNIIETLQNILDKADAQQAALRKAEQENLYNFQLLEQSILDEIKFGNKDSAAAKKGLATSGEKKAGAEGDLRITTKDLNEDIEALRGTKQDCATHTEEYDAAVASRNDELKALAEAKKVILETTGGADTIAYGLNQVSFLQRSSATNFAAVRFVRDLAKKRDSPALAQLASRMASAMQVESETGSDQFAKVKGLISAMLERLEAEADADATHKAFCDKHLAETHEKKEDKTAEIAKLTTSIDQMSARSAKLKEEVAALSKALADLLAFQSQMDKIRADENAAFLHDKAETEEGLQGVKMALKILRDYYAQDNSAHGAADGAAGGIIGLLEVVESDFTKGLAEMVATESSAQAAYEKQTKENQIEQTTKEQDVKYKNKETARLDKSVAETTSDRSGVQAELDAALEYLAKLEDQCLEKVETYAERKERRAAEIAGLHEALEILESETALFQQSSRKFLRRH